MVTNTSGCASAAQGRPSSELTSGEERVQATVARLGEPVQVDPEVLGLLLESGVRPGAEVSVDAFPLPGTTPIQGVPVTAREERTVRVTREGYLPFEDTFDMTRDRSLRIALDPVPAPEGAVAPAPQLSSSEKRISPQPPSARACTRASSARVCGVARIHSRSK